MSEPKFTPGPWRAGKSIYQSQARVVAEKGGRVADVFAYEEDQSHANATLISLAPEMLNELEVVQKAMLAIAEYSADEEIKESARQHAAHINIVVKKASGEK